MEYPVVTMGLVSRFWTYVMIFCVLYFFAIIATSLIGKADAFKDDELAQARWKPWQSDCLLEGITANYQTKISNG
jgi:hypothetical protein